MRTLVSVYCRKYTLFAINRVFRELFVNLCYAILCRNVESYFIIFMLQKFKVIYQDISQCALIKLPLSLIRKVPVN